MTADDDVVVKLEQVLLRDGIFRRDQIWKVAMFILAETVRFSELYSEVCVSYEVQFCVDKKQNVALEA